jgi:hypothetical protein
MKKLPKRDDIRRPRIYRGRGTVEAMRAVLIQGIANLLADIGETEDCVLQIVPRGRTGKRRLGLLRKRVSKSVRPLLARCGKG